MASHVVVIDASARRYPVKTTPSTYLNDVLHEACVKAGLKPDQYTLKHNEKQVDLSRTMRLAGLGQGAKLMLVQASRSPSVVNVALQLPSDGPTAANGPRLTDKFPSDTSVWQILRRFESGVAGGATTTGKNLNLTQRATPMMANGGAAGMTVSGAGRLCYEMPVINIMGRQLETFADLQKTLGQLGITGSALMRLQYNSSQQPLEEAMTEISSFFAPDEGHSTPAPAASAETARPVVDEADSQAQSLSNNPPTAMDTTPDSIQPPQHLTPSSSHPAAEAAAPSTVLEPPTATTTTPSQPQLSSAFEITLPPTSATPAAAAFVAQHNESDYIPTIEHAKAHQAALTRASRNKKLLSDEEEAAQAQERADVLAAITTVSVQLRFPDQYRLRRTYGAQATVSDLYADAREAMELSPGEDIELCVARADVLSEREHGARRLIADLGWRVPVLVTVVWAEGTGAERRKRASLKERYRAQGRPQEVSAMLERGRGEGGPENAAKVEKGGGDDVKGKKKEGGGGGDKEAKMKRLLGKLSKK